MNVIFRIYKKGVAVACSLLLVTSSVSAQTVEQKLDLATLDRAANHSSSFCEC